MNEQHIAYIDSNKCNCLGTKKETSYFCKTVTSNIFLAQNTHARFAFSVEFQKRHLTTFTLFQQYRIVQNRRVQNWLGVFHY